MMLGIGGSARADLLAAGQDAPPITGMSVIDGKREQFDLKSAAAKQAVVLYFFPAAFTAG